MSDTEKDKTNDRNKKSTNDQKADELAKAADVVIGKSELTEDKKKADKVLDKVAQEAKAAEAFDHGKKAAK